VNKSFSQGYQFTAHYTWSQAFNYDADYYAIDPRVNYGPADFNRKHVFVMTNLVELPWGKGKKFLNTSNRAVDALVGGWQINTITNWSSGLPFTPGMADCSSRDTGPCRPDKGSVALKTGVGNYDPVAGTVVFFQTLQPLSTTDGQAFRAPAAGTFGNSGRNSITGPSFFNTDLSVFKNFSITERWKAQFRTEIFNVFNYTSLGNPNSCVDCGGGGLITGTAIGYRPRQVQFGLKINF